MCPPQIQPVISSPEPKVRGSYKHGMCPSSTLSTKYIAAASEPILIKFHVKHHQVGGKAAYFFQADRSGNLVAMATLSSH